MKQLLVKILLVFSCSLSFAVQAQQNQNVAVVQNHKDEKDFAENDKIIVNEEEGFSYTINPEGIKLSINKKNTSIRLFDLTGQRLWSGDALQGSFLIPINPGIYILRVNDKSHKIVCKY